MRRRQRLCEPCSQEWQRWLDYRAPVPIQLVSIGITSVRAVEESRRLRAETIRQTIRTQQALITAACARNHQGGSS